MVRDYWQGQWEACGGDYAVLAQYPLLDKEGLLSSHDKSLYRQDTESQRWQATKMVLAVDLPLKVRSDDDVALKHQIEDHQHRIKAMALAAATAVGFEPERQGEIDAALQGDTWSALREDAFARARRRQRLCTIIDWLAHLGVALAIGAVAFTVQDGASSTAARVAVAGGVAFTLGFVTWVVLRPLRAMAEGQRSRRGETVTALMWYATVLAAIVVGLLAVAGVVGRTVVEVAVALPLVPLMLTVVLVVLYRVAIAHADGWIDVSTPDQRLLFDFLYLAWLSSILMYSDHPADQPWKRLTARLGMASSRYRLTFIRTARGTGGTHKTAAGTFASRIGSLFEAHRSALVAPLSLDDRRALTRSFLNGATLAARRDWRSLLEAAPPPPSKSRRLAERAVGPILLASIAIGATLLLDLDATLAVTLLLPALGLLVSPESADRAWELMKYARAEQTSGG
jgi:hypothetical protein